MEIRQIYYFIVLAQELCLSNAAERCFVTQQAVSKSIRSLESVLNAKLFYRDHGKLKLTSFGQSAYPLLEKLYTNYESTKQILLYRSQQEEGLIKIAFSIAVVSGKLEQYLNNYPFVKIQLTELPDVFCEQYVNDHKCDIGFSIGIPNNEINFTYQLFKKNQLCAMMKPDHPLALNKTVTLDQVSKYPLIMKNETYKSYEYIYDLATRRNLTLDIQTRSLNIMFQKLLIESNDSIAIGTTYLIENNSNYVCVPFEEKELNWDIYIITKKGHYLSDKAITLIDDLIDFGKTL